MARAKKNEDKVCSKRELVAINTSNIFKVLGDKTRLEILFALETKSMCVGELVNSLGFSQSLVSHQLRVLRDNNIVSTVRNGNKVFYMLADDHITTLLNIAKAHISERL